MIVWQLTKNISKKREMTGLWPVYKGEGYTCTRVNPSWRAKDSSGLQAKFYRKGYPTPDNLKPVYRTEKMGTDPSKREYGPHIFARVNNPYHVLGDGYGPVFFLVLGPQNRRLWPQNQKKIPVRTRFLILASVCVTISLMTCAVKKNLSGSPKTAV